MDGFIARKLDGVLVNDVWMENFGHSTMEFLAHEVSDHCPSLIQFEEVMYSPPKPFKLCNCWTKHQNFLKIVKESWKTPIRGNAMSILHKKLKRLKVVLREFNLTHFGGISKRVDEKRRELASVQMSVLNTPSPNLIELEKTLTLQLYDLMLADESFF